MTIASTQIADKVEQHPASSDIVSTYLSTSSEKRPTTKIDGTETPIPDSSDAPTILKGDVLIKKCEGYLTVLGF